MSISWDGHNTVFFRRKVRLFCRFLAFALRGRRFLIFLGCFSGRYFILSMFECHVRFERIFGKISEHVELQHRWILLYQSLPLQKFFKIRLHESDRSFDLIAVSDCFQFQSQKRPWMEFTIFYKLQVEGSRTINLFQMISRVEKVERSG